MALQFPYFSHNFLIFLLFPYYFIIWFYEMKSVTLSPLYYFDTFLTLCKFVCQLSSVCNKLPFDFVNKLSK